MTHVYQRGIECVKRHLKQKEGKERHQDFFWALTSTRRLPIL